LVGAPFRVLFPERVLPRATSRLHRSDRPQVEPLVERVLPAVTATFLPGAGTLSIFGDALDKTTTVSRDAAGQILVNGGAVNVLGGTTTVAGRRVESGWKIS
jgi:hypothetical protein